jgi:co-chaperonin GroES (HSP10)
MANKKFIPLHDNLLVKLNIIKSKSGIILAPNVGETGNGRLKSDYTYEPVAEVAAVGDDVKKVKAGDKIVLTKPHFIVINMEKLTREPCGEKAGFDYIKAKEEDIFAVIK